MSTPDNHRHASDSDVAPGAPRKRVAVSREPRTINFAHVLPAMPPPQALAERDSATLLLNRALHEIRSLTQQAAHLADLHQEAEMRADANERAYHDAFTKLAVHERWECVAQCCEGPVTDMLYRLADCRHFVCQSHITAKVRARRNTVAVPANAEHLLGVTCPVCRGVPQNVNIFLHAIPFSSGISPMGVMSVSRDGVNELLKGVAECVDLASFPAGRDVRDRAIAMQPSAFLAEEQNSVWVPPIDDDDFDPLAAATRSPRHASPEGDFV